MKCRKCGTENIADAKFCRHCGDNLKNIMDTYPELNFVPTNFMDWKKPKVGMTIKEIFMIPIIISVLVCLYCIWSYFFYNQLGEYENREWITYTEDPIFGVFYETARCYEFDDGYYSDYHYNYDTDEKYVDEGDYVYNHKEWTAEKSLAHYREYLSFNIFGYAVAGIFLFIVMHFVICGYPKRPKNTKPLHEVADYCQKYSYWGIFRRRKTPKFVFFVKDNMFGILDVAHYSVFLPARYDSLSWREKNKYLNAVIDGRYCIIDIYGKELK